MTYRNMIGKTLAGVIALGLLGTAGAASAQQIQVKYRPYELATSAGTAAVYKRITRQAGRACRSVTPLELRFRQVCKTELVDSVIAQIGNPALSAMHAGETPVRLASAE